VTRKPREVVDEGFAGEMWRIGQRMQEQYERTGRWISLEEFFYRGSLVYMGHLLAGVIRTEAAKPVRRKVLCAKRGHLLGELYSVNHEVAKLVATMDIFAGEPVQDLRLPADFDGPLWLARMRPTGGRHDATVAWIDWPGWGGPEIGLPWDVAGYPDPGLPVACPCGERTIPVRVLVAFTRQETPWHLRI
jgi:hypothetical protein